MEYRIVDKPQILEWIKKKRLLPAELETRVSKVFGPFRIRGVIYHVQYDSLNELWNLVHEVDNSLADYFQRRGQLAQLADQHGETMGRGELVQFLIQAAITTGFVTRSSIVDAVEFATNVAGIRESLETNRDYASIPTQFDEAFIKRVLSKHQGLRSDRHLWWVDNEKTYHLH